MKKLLFILFFFFSLYSFSQIDSVFVVDSFPLPDSTHQKIPATQLNKYWKYHKGDDSKWADPSFDDNEWMHISPSLDFKRLPAGAFETIGWFRLWIEVDTQFVDQTLGLMITQSGASEIYLDGNLLHKFG